MLLKPLFDGIFPMIYLLDPTFFWISTPIVLLIETLVLWQQNIGSFQRSGLYSIIINTVSGLLGAIILLFVFPYETPFEPSPIPMGIMMLYYCVIPGIWLTMLVFSILSERYILYLLEPHKSNVGRAIVIANILSYTMFLFAFPIHLTGQEILH